MFLILVTSVLIYFDMRTSMIYIALAAGFLLVGVGILLGFIQMVKDDEHDHGK